MLLYVPKDINSGELKVNDISLVSMTLVDGNYLDLMSRVEHLKLSKGENENGWVVHEKGGRSSDRAGDGGERARK